MIRPLQALLIPEDAIGAVTSGMKNITIRKKHRDYKKGII